MLEQRERFTQRARRVVALASEEARRLNHSHVGTEHLLLGLVREKRGTAARVLANLGIALDKVQSSVESLVPAGEGAAEGELDLTGEARRALELAADEAEGFGQRHVGSEHILLGLAGEKEGIAARVLASLGASFERVEAEVARIASAVVPTEVSLEPIQIPGGQVWRLSEAAIVRRHLPPAPPEQAAAGLNVIVEEVRAHLDSKHVAREHALSLCRDALRHSANAIRAVHRGEFATAENLLAQAKTLLEQASKALADHPDIFYAGFVHNAQKEFAEGSLTLALVSRRPLPSPQELGVDHAPYLNGLGEAVGELRRYLLDSLRGGDISRCETALAAMDDIYTVLVSLDYPEAITGGLRRTTDAMRGILERTRGDLTMALVQRNLERRLEEFEGRLPSGK